MRLPKEPIDQMKVFTFLWGYFICIFLSMKDIDLDLVHITEFRLICLIKNKGIGKFN